MVTVAAESEPALEVRTTEPCISQSKAGRRLGLFAGLFAIIAVNLVVVWMISGNQVIAMPSRVNLGDVESGTPLFHPVVIRNHSDHAITCLGATVACGYGCYQPSHLPARIEPGGLIEVIVEYKPPHPETLVRRGLASGLVTDEMLFYFDDPNVPPQTLAITCQVAMPAAATDQKPAIR